VSCTPASTYTAKYAYESNSRLVKSVVFTNNASGEGMLTTRAWDRLNRDTTGGRASGGRDYSAGELN